MYKVVGIDEAGKGPVIGSMFIGFVICNLTNGLKDLNAFQDNLKNVYQVKDSKLLTPKKRAEIFSKLKEDLDIKYAQLTPSIIDNNNALGGKLNELEVEAIVKVLNQIKPDLIMIDALTARPDKFGEDIKKRLSFDCKIIAENKADSKYPIVGAASIVAKQLREQEIEEIKHNIKLDCGSGYPSDPQTKKFLKEHYASTEFDFIFRKSWATYKNYLKKDSDFTLNKFISRDDE